MRRAIERLSFFRRYLPKPDIITVRAYGIVCMYEKVREARRVTVRGGFAYRMLRRQGLRRHAVRHAHVLRAVGRVLYRFCRAGLFIVRVPFYV